MSPLVKKARYQVNLRVVREEKKFKPTKKKELIAKTPTPTPIGMKDD